MSTRAYLAAFDLVTEAAQTAGASAEAIVVSAQRAGPNRYVTHVAFLDGAGVALSEFAVPQKHRRLNENFARALVQEARKHAGNLAGSIHGHLSRSNTPTLLAA